MKISRTSILFLLVFLYSQVGYAQLDNATMNKMKVMYLTAQNKYDEGDYTGAITKIADLEVVGNGLVLPSSQNLKVKSLLGAKRYAEASYELEILQGLDLTADIIQDMATYSDKIEDGVRLVRLNPVEIGGQLWADKNLNVTNFRNGDPIPEISNMDEWKRAEFEARPAIWRSDNNNDNVRAGKLYNYWALVDPRGLAPEGWRIATSDDWKRLINVVGMGKEVSSDEIKNKQFHFPKAVKYLSNEGYQFMFGKDKDDFFAVTNNSVSGMTDNPHSSWRTVDIEAKNNPEFVKLHKIDKLIALHGHNWTLVRNCSGYPVRCVKE